MQAGSITFSTALDNSQLEKDLAGLKKKIEKKEREIADLSLKRDAAKDKGALDAAALDAEKRKLQEIKDRLSDIQSMSKDKGLNADTRQKYKDMLPGVKEELADQKSRVSALQTEWTKLENSVDRYTVQLNEAEAALNRQKEEAGYLQQQISEAEARRTEIAGAAAVSDRHTVSLNRELLKLKERQKELESVGIGFGYQEYDRNASRIAKITEELKEYEKALSGTGKAAEQASEKMNSLLGKMASLMKSSNSAALQSAGAAISAISPKIAIAVAAAKGVKAVADKAGAAMGNAFKKILSAAGRAASAVKSFGTAAEKAFARATMGAVKLLEKVNLFPKMFSSIGKSLKKLSSLIKQALVFSVVYKGLSLVREQMGAYLSVNNQFMTALRRLQGVLLTAFQPIYEMVVPALTVLINSLTRAIATVTQFFASLFGTTAKKAQANAKALYDQANATKEAGKAAKKAAGSLAAFDEINTIQTENKTSAADKDADAGPLFDYEFEDTAFDSWGEAFSAFLDKLLAGIPALKEKFKDFADWLNNLNQKLYDMFTFPGVLDKVKQLGHDLADALNELVNMINWELWGRALGAGLNLALNFLTSFLYEFDWMNLGRKLAEFVNGLVDEIDWYEFGRLLWAGFKIALETLAGFILGLDMPLMAQAASNIVKGFFDEMTNTLTKIPWFTIGTQIATFLNEIDWYGTLTSVIKAIQAALLALQQTISGFVGELKWSEIAEQIYTAINDSLGKFPWKLLGKTLGDLFIHVFDFVREVIAGINWRQIGEDIAAFINGIDWIELLASLAGAIAAGINAAIHLLGGLVANLDWATIGIAIGNAINRLIEDIDWASAGQAFSDALNGMITFAINALETIDWDAIGEAVETFMSNIDWDTLMANIGRLIADIFGAKLNLAFLGLKILLEIGGHIVSGLLNGILQGLVNIGTWLKEHLVDPIVSKVKEFFGIHSPSTVFAEIGRYLISGLLQGISDTWNGIVTFFSEKIDALKQSFSAAWENIKSTASEKWESIKTTLGNAWDNIKETARTSFEEVRKKVGDTWEDIKTEAPKKWEEIRGSLKDKWDAVKSDAAEKFQNVKKSIIDKMDELKDHDWAATGSSIVKGIKNGIDSAWAGITSWASNAASWLEKKFRNATSNLGKAKSSGGTINTAPRAAAASLPDISTFNIPALARGAVIPPNREFLAVLGDQRSGTNIEAPLETIEQAVSNVLSRSGYGGGDLHITVELDGKVVARNTVRHIKDMNRSAGKSVLES